MVLPSGTLTSSAPVSSSGTPDSDGLCTFRVPSLLVLVPGSIVVPTVPVGSLSPLGLLFKGPFLLFSSFTSNRRLLLHLLHRNCPLIWPGATCHTAEERTQLMQQSRKLEHHALAVVSVKGQ